MHSKIKVLASGSQGNCYLLQANEEEKLILECGIPFKEMLKGLDFDLRGVCGCLITHIHQDHSRAFNEVLGYGIDIYTNKDVVVKKNCTRLNKVHIKENEHFKIGNFKIISFNAYHTNSDNTECPTQGFLIHHPNIGKVLFATDTYMLPKFKNVDYIMVECNYSEQFLKDDYLTKRLVKSHMSLENLKTTLSNWEVSGTKEIMLLHLSDRHGDAKMFKKEIEKVTGIPVHIAVPGTEI